MGSAETKYVVLLADGEVLVRNLVRRILEEAGWLVLAAADANEALTISRACDHRIDVLIVDMDIPGMNGLVLADKIQREREDILILLTSAGTTQRVPSKMPFIAKPFPPKELAETIEKALTAKSKDAA